jgi:hypothetical protein
MIPPVVPAGRLRDRTQPRLTADGVRTAGMDMHLHARLRGDPVCV